MVYPSQPVIGSGIDLLPSSVTVSAAANIALIKYWGKRDGVGNQPATASLSAGMDDLRTTTTLSFSDTPEHTFETALDLAATTRITRFLDVLYERFELSDRLHIETANNFPTGTGLASSASGFAALTLGVNALFNLALSPTILSQLARMGSGSAARSIFGGFVEVIPADDAYAQPLLSSSQWPLDIIVAVTNDAPKEISSTAAMLQTANTSPLYDTWLSSHPADMLQAKTALHERDFDKLAAVSELSCLKMHSAIMTSAPPILYWQPATIAVMHEVQRARSQGIAAFYSIDAGAQVKVFCEPESTSALLGRLTSINGVTRTLQTKVGGEPLVNVK
jgi:diphosphomevalonate decarboxylase